MKLSASEVHAVLALPVNIVIFFLALTKETKPNIGFSLIARAAPGRRPLMPMYIMGLLSVSVLERGQNRALSTELSCM